MSIPRPGLEQLEPGGVPDGIYVVRVESNIITALDPTGVTAGTGPITVDNTDPANPIISSAVLLTTVIDGTPALVWDQFNLVYTEVSP